MNEEYEIWIYLLSQYGNALQNFNPSVSLITKGKNVFDDPTEMSFKKMSPIFKIPFQ